jgi:CelD/BcsL family acetyltransferase involved in cellulose biosynthesis
LCGPRRRKSARTCHDCDGALHSWSPLVPGLVVKRLDSLSELRQIAPAWDELWQRSEVALPTARAALLALWCESFAHMQPFQAFVVEHDGQPVAALPLVEGKRRGLSIGLLPGNHWSPAGDLLLDPGCDVSSACAALVSALKEQAHGLVWFEAVPGDSNRWQSLRKAFDEQRTVYARRRRLWIDEVEIAGDWTAYFDSRSANHRKHMRKAAARAERAGGVELVCHEWLTPEAVERLLNACFEIEACGWKGAAGSAVLNVPVVRQFYLRQAQLLAASGQLSLTFLQHEGRSIAFEYGWRSKGVYFSPKVGYDEAFSHFSPGQLLRSRLLAEFHHERNMERVDFLGPSSAATAKWATGQYAIDRIAVATRGPVNRAIVAALRGYESLVAGPSGSAARPKVPRSSHTEPNEIPVA